ncbi:MAG: hypothetical protein WDZ35_06155 [Crocinitomicaceae bacterium]
MKKIGILGALFFLTTSLFAQYDNAGDYMAAISEQYKSIQKDMWDYTNAASHGKNAHKIDKKRAALVETTYQAKNNVRRLKGFEDYTDYRDSVVSFLSIYYSVLKQDYAAIVNMEEIAEKSYDNMEAYMMAKEEANNRLSEASDMLSAEQKKFAEKFNVTLMEASDELNEKMKIADEVYTYYNEIYLIFFKSYIQDIYLTEALAKGDVSAIEQNKSALSATTQEGLDKLKGIESYKGDNSVVEACKGVLEFYKDEAENQVVHLTNYFIKAENFKTIKTSFDQKKEKDRTQEDVDQFNAAVNESNAAGQKYNEVNEMLNKQKAEKIDGWNKTVHSFIDKHVPKGKA